MPTIEGSIDFAQLSLLLLRHHNALTTMERPTGNGIKELCQRLEVAEYEQEINLLDSYYKFHNNFAQQFVDRCRLRNSKAGKNIAISLLENWSTPSNHLYLELAEFIFGSKKKINKNKITMPVAKFFELFAPDVEFFINFAINANSDELLEEVTLKEEPLASIKLHNDSLYYLVNDDKYLCSSELNNLTNVQHERVIKKYFAEYPDLAAKAFPTYYSTAFRIRLPQELLATELEKMEINPLDWVVFLEKTSPECYPILLQSRLGKSFNPLNYLNEKLHLFNAKQVSSLAENIGIFYKKHALDNKTFYHIASIKNPVFLRYLLLFLGEKKVEVLKEIVAEDISNFGLILSCSKEHILIVLEALTKEEQLELISEITLNMHLLFKKNKLQSLWEKFPHLFSHLLNDPGKYLNLLLNTSELEDQEPLKFLVSLIDDTILQQVKITVDQYGNTIFHQRNYYLLNFLKEKLSKNDFKNGLLRRNSEQEPALHYLLDSCELLALVDEILVDEWPNLLEQEDDSKNTILHHAAMRDSLEFFLDHPKIPIPILALSLQKVNAKKKTPIYYSVYYPGDFVKIRSNLQKIVKLIIPQEQLLTLFLQQDNKNCSLMMRISDINKLLQILSDLFSVDNQLVLLSAEANLKRFSAVENFKDLKNNIQFTQENWNNFLAKFLKIINFEQFIKIESSLEPRFFIGFIAHCDDKVFAQFLAFISLSSQGKWQSTDKIDLSCLKRHPHLLNAILCRLSCHNNWNFSEQISGTISTISKQALPIIIPYLPHEQKILWAKMSWFSWDCVGYEWQLNAVKSFSEDDLMSVIEPEITMHEIPLFLLSAQNGLCLLTQFSVTNRLRLLLSANIMGFSLLSFSLNNALSMKKITKAMPIFSLLEALNTLEVAKILSSVTCFPKSIQSGPILRELKMNPRLFINTPEKKVFPDIHEHFSKLNIQFTDDLENTKTLLEKIEDGKIIGILLESFSDAQLLQLTQQKKFAHHCFLKTLFSKPDYVRQLTERLNLTPNLTKQFYQSLWQSKTNLLPELFSQEQTCKLFLGNFLSALGKNKQSLLGKVIKEYEEPVLQWLVGRIYAGDSEFSLWLHGDEDSPLLGVWLPFVEVLNKDKCNNHPVLFEWEKLFNHLHEHLQNLPYPCEKADALIQSFYDWFAKHDKLTSNRSSFFFSKKNAVNQENADEKGANCITFSQ